MVFFLFIGSRAPVAASNNFVVVARTESMVYMNKVAGPMSMSNQAKSFTSGGFQAISNDGST